MEPIVEAKIEEVQPETVELPVLVAEAEPETKNKKRGLGFWNKILDNTRIIFEGEEDKTLS